MTVNLTDIGIMTIADATRLETVIEIQELVNQLTNSPLPRRITSVRLVRLAQSQTSTVLLARRFSRIVGMVTLVIPDQLCDEIGRAHV